MTEERGVAQEVGFDAGVDALVQVNAAAVKETKAGGADFQVVGVEGAVGDDERGAGFAGAAVAGTGGDGVEHG